MTGYDSDGASGQAAPGWYPTAPGSPTYRWWDGQRWTEVLQNLDQLTPQPQSTVTKATPVYNVFIWLVVLLPLVSTLSLIPLNLGSLMEESMRQSLANPGTRSFTNSAMMTPGYFLVQAVSWVVFAVVVVMAYFDWKRLGRVGFARRFHWAWAFLGIVYVIGRTVMVRRESGRGLGVIWAYLAVTVVSLVIVGSQLVAGISAMTSMMSQYR